MTKPLKLGVAGLGTVGSSLLQLIETHGERLAAALPRPLKVDAVSARTRSKNRGLCLEQMRWFDDPVALAGDDSIDVFVELIGGEDGPAKAAVETALGACQPSIVDDLLYFKISTILVLRRTGYIDLYIGNVNVDTGHIRLVAGLCPQVHRRVP